MTLLLGCGTHPPLGNGSFTLSHDHGFWSLATYYCIPDFYLIGAILSRCNGGPWTNPPPICKSMFAYIRKHNFYNFYSNIIMLVDVSGSKGLVKSGDKFFLSRVKQIFFKYFFSIDIGNEHCPKSACC